MSEFVTGYSRPRCICGCGQPSANRHHVVYAQHLSREDRKDTRNLVPVAWDCHGAHHSAFRRLSLHRLPDSVFTFASEVLGAEKGYEYLKRYYDGQDLRHERMLLEAAA